MGRLRNLSHSLKAVAFPHANSNPPSPSPATPTPNATPNATPMPIATANANADTRSPDSPIGSPTTKHAPVITREESSTSTLFPTATATSPSPAGHSASRPSSQFYDPPTMASGREDQIEELRPVFSFLSSHQNKLYQEGYFLKLNDLDTQGKPNADRNWTECFAQLVGTVLSLWDAAALDAAGQDGEVSPTFVNLADASIKMIETLPTRNSTVQPLQNVLSISTAGKNRYLFHFNSLHSLTQWTAGIRLSMFEHSSLHELYTGSLIAGKGKTLNNIRQIMEKSKFKEEDWCRVRFGAGTPWRRCWFVIEPPDEKEWQKANKSLKKKGAYDRISLPKGNLKFYDTKKTKKATPIATISDVFSAYAVYPESKPLIDQSTLVKLEGTITIHSKPESETEGFVFVMPEVRPAVSGFEILLRFLFPIYDTFTLYGRPSRLIADTLDARGLMFAMPKNRRYGYLDIIDVAGLIHSDGSDKWTEREWRKRTKDMVSRRMSGTASSRNSESESRRSLGSRPAIRFGGNSSPIDGEPPNQSTDAIFTMPKKTYTAPPAAQSTPSIKGHHRSVSETFSSLSPAKRKQQREYIPSKLAGSSQANGEDIDVSPPPPMLAYRQAQRGPQRAEDDVMRSSANSSDSDLQQTRLDPQDVTRDLPVMTPPTPVAQPTFNHQANDQPTRRPRDRPDLRREKSRMSSATLSQLADANRGSNGQGQAGAAAAAAWNNNGRQDEYGRGVNYHSHFEDTRSYANPVVEAINSDDATYDRTEGISPYRPQQPRPLSQHSITRKPLPSQSQPTTPIQPQSTHSLPDPTERDQSFPGFGDLHITTMLPPTTSGNSGGMRKLVGDPRYTEVNRQNNIPDINFGVTKSLDFRPSPPHSRPSTGGRISPLPLPVGRASPPAGAISTTERKSYYGPRTPTTDQPRPSSQIWQPGSQPAGKQSPGSLTAEEFVQQRAAAARNPYGVVSRRHHSPVQRDDKAVSPAVTPPPAKKLQPRNSSRPSSSDSYVGHRLSARGQEQVARMSGGPLINLQERSHVGETPAGLIGAIEFREQERRTTREGISGQLAQAEFSRRQQAQAQQMQQGYYPHQVAYQPAEQVYQTQQYSDQYSHYLPSNEGFSHQHQTQHQH